MANFTIFKLWKRETLESLLRIESEADNHLNYKAK